MNLIVREMAKLGAIDTEIARALDISIPTLHDWKRRYPALLKASKLSKAKADDRVKGRLFESATNGDTTAAIFWLKNRRPAEWRDKQEISTTKEISVIHRVIVDPEPEVIEGGEVKVIEDAHGLLEPMRQARNTADKE